MTIREARAGELPALRDVERAAGQCFREAGMPEIADDEPLPEAALGDDRWPRTCMRRPLPLP